MTNSINITLISTGYKGRLHIKDNVWISESWKISKDSAKSLIGGLISLHEHKKDDSYEVGRITGYYETNGRYALVYQQLDNQTNVVTGSDKNWGQEKAFYE